MRKGETAANVFFNILATRLYKAFMKTLDDKGRVFGLTDDVNIVYSPEVMGDIVIKLLALTTHATKNRVYIQPTPRASWVSYLDDDP